VRRGNARINTDDALVVKAPLAVLVAPTEPAEVVLDAAEGRVADTTAEVGEMLTEARPS